VKPAPLVIPWQGRQLRIRHDDPHLTPLTDQGKRIAVAVQLAFDVEACASSWRRPWAIATAST
jgi:hypothetical protein